MLLKGQGVPEDARTLARAGLIELRRQLRVALARPTLRMPPETKAHLGESVARIDEALQARAERSAF